MTIRTPKLTRLAVALLLTGAVITFTALRSGPIRAFAAHAGHGNHCGARGTYGYTGFGNVFPGNLTGFPPGIASTNGTITLDGKGNMLIHEVEVIEGHVVSPPKAPRSLAPTRSIPTAPSLARSLLYRHPPWLAWSSIMANRSERC